MLNKYILFLWPTRDFERDPEVIASTEVFIKCVSFAVVLRLIYFLFNLYHGWSLVALGPAIQVTLQISALVLFRYQQRLTIAGHLPILGFFALCSITMWFTNGIQSPIIINIPVIIMTAIVVVGWRLGLAWAGVFVGLIVWYYWMDNTGQLPKSKIHEDDLNRFILITYLTGTVIFLLIYSVYKDSFLRFKNILRSQREESSYLLRAISHDLRSPLQIIQSYTQLLGEASSKEKADEYTQQIQKSLERVTVILNQVRGYEGVLGGKKIVELQPMDLCEVIDDLLITLYPQYKNKNIHINFDPPADQRFMILSDSVALSEHVISNFLSNAFKFTPPNGNIGLSITKKKNVVSLEIADDGIGMSSETMGMLFNFSKTATRLGTEGEKGSGFGMPIAKMFMDQMKINFKIESRELEKFPKDHGTKVTLSFTAAN